MNHNGHHDGRDDQRVVITGMGVVTPLGHTVTELWDNLLAGKSAARKIDRFDPSHYAVKICSDIPETGFDVEAYSDVIDKKKRVGSTLLNNTPLPRPPRLSSNQDW